MIGLVWRVDLALVAGMIVGGVTGVLAVWKLLDRMSSALDRAIADSPALAALSRVLDQHTALLATLQRQSGQINAAVNNVAPGEKSLVRRVAAVEQTLAEILGELKRMDPPNVT